MLRVPPVWSSGVAGPGMSGEREREEGGWPPPPLRGLAAVAVAMAVTRATREGGRGSGEQGEREETRYFFRSVQKLKQEPSIYLFLPDSDEKQGKTIITERSWQKVNSKSRS
jgi:hypothetical protein